MEQTKHSLGCVVKERLTLQKWLVETKQHLQLGLQHLDKFMEYNTRRIEFLLKSRSRVLPDAVCCVNANLICQYEQSYHSSFEVLGKELVALKNITWLEQLVQNSKLQVGYIVSGMKEFARLLPTRGN